MHETIELYLCLGVKICIEIFQIIRTEELGKKIRLLELE